MKKLLCDKKFNILYSALAVALMWAVWLIVAAAVDNSFLVAPVGEAVKEFFLLFAKAFFWRALGHSLARAVIAFLISFALALGCSCISATFKPFAAFMRPVTAFMRTLPTMVVLLLILVWLTPRTAPAAVVFIVLFPMIYSQLSDGIAGIDGELLEMATAYNFKARQKLAYIYCPHLAPLALEQAGANLAFALKLTVSAEVMASTYTALGGMLAEAQAYINLPRLAAITLVTVALGIALELAFRFAAQYSFGWKRAAKSD